MDALGDKTRRAILEQLRGGPRPVVDIASALPVGRPAVSQHLKVLKNAGLVTDRALGTRRVYEINRSGIEAAHDYLSTFWSEALERFKAGVESHALREEGQELLET